MGNAKPDSTVSYGGGLCSLGGAVTGYQLQYLVLWLSGRLGLQVCVVSAKAPVHLPAGHTQGSGPLSTLTQFNQGLNSI